VPKLKLARRPLRLVQRVAMHRITLLFLLTLPLVALGEDSRPRRQTIAAPINDVFHGDESGFSGRVFTVSLQVIHPMVFFDETKEGNERFSGYTIDMLDLLKEELKCDFTYFVGDPDEPESANAALEAVGAGKGIGETREADFAAGMIHMTANRSRLVHFTTPYMSSGYVMVVPVPSLNRGLWNFFSPFDELLWVLVLFEMIVVAIAFYITEAPHLTVHPETDVEGTPLLAAADVMYFSVSLLTCTLDKSPRTWGGKCVMLGHGWFMLILIASYTANLASFLTANALSPKITGWDSITSTGTQYKLVIPRGTAHKDFLEFEEGHYGFEFNYEEVATFEEAFAMVAEGKADATFEDEPVVQYYLEEEVPEEYNCKLMQVGRLFAPVGYGLAFSLDSQDFIAFSQAIVHLQELGDTTRLQYKWEIGPGASTQTELCGSPGGDGSGEFLAGDFWGLTLMTALFVIVGLLINIYERYAASRAAPPTAPARALNDFPPAGEPATKADDLETAIQRGVADALTGAGHQPGTVQATVGYVYPR